MKISFAQTAAKRIQTAFQIVAYLLPAAALFGPFVRLPMQSNAFVLALGLLAAFYLLLALSARRPKFGTASGYVFCLALALCYAAVSLCWARNLSYSLECLYYQVSGAVVAAIILCAVSGRHDFLCILDVLTVCFLLTVAIGIFEIVTGRFLFGPTNPEIIFRNKYNFFFPYAAFNNTNDYAAYVTLFLPFAVYDMVMRLRGAAGVLCAFLAGTAALFTLFNADPRVCYIGMAVMTAVFFAGALFKKDVRRRWKRLVEIFLALAGSLGILGATSLFRANVVAQELGSINFGNHSVSERLMLTKAAFRMIVSSHFLGVGVGNSATLVPYFSASIRAFNLHNVSLQILTEYGIIILILYAGSLLFLAVRFLKTSAGSFSQDILNLICLATVCGFPIVGIAPSDVTHLSAVWVLPGLWLAARKLLVSPKPERAKKRLLLDTFIDFGDMASGSSVRPQRMARAFEQLGFQVDLLSGLQNRHLERNIRVFRKWREVRRNLPDFCYVEPPSGPFFNFCDHLLLIYLKRKGVPCGLFYRDAYWKFASWWQVKGIKKFILVQMQKFDLFVIRRTCKVVFFPTKSMAELFDLPCKDVLPPAGADFIVPEHQRTHRALYIGGVSGFYGTDILLAAFDLLNGEMKRNIHLTVVCRVSESSRFFDGYRGRPWLTVAHASGDKQLKPFYEQSDIALYPSRRDFYMDFCMPVKLFEYLSRALPVVCTDCREAAAFVEQNGIGLVTKSDPRAFARAVARLYEEPGLMESIRERCKKVLLGQNLWTHRANYAAVRILSSGSEKRGGLSERMTEDSHKK